MINKNYAKSILRLFVLIVVFPLSFSFSVAQCPIVDDTLFVFNPELPYSSNIVYIPYLRNGNIGMTDNYWSNANSEYVWISSSTYDYTYHIESGNAVFLNASNVQTATSFTYNVYHNLVPSAATAGRVTDGGSYYSSPIVTSNIVDRVARVQLQPTFYGYTNFNIRWQSCDPYTWVEATFMQSNASVYTTTATITYLSYTVVRTSLISTYACTNAGGVCSAWGTYVSSQYGTSYQQSLLSTYLVTWYDYYRHTNATRCMNNAYSPRTSCTKKIWLYIQRPTDVSVTKTCSKSQYVNGEPVEFTIRASSNLFGAELDSCKVTDVLPSGLVLLSYSLSGGSYDVSTGVWTLPTMGDSRYYELKIKAMALITGDYTNVATLNNIDFDYSNNSASCDFFAEGLVNLPDPVLIDCVSEINVSTDVCVQDTLIFSTQNLPNVTYLWNVPDGYTLVSGAGTNVITTVVGESSGFVGLVVTHLPTDSTALTTCERSKFVEVNGSTNDIRIR